MDVSAEKSGLMDQMTTETEILKNSVKHIHCWHTDELFSKFKFQNGEYKDLDLTDYLEIKR